MLLLAASLLLSLGLDRVSASAGVPGTWPAFTVTLLLCAALIWGALRALRSESPPEWLYWLTLGAALLRLGAGVIWYLALPVAGYQSEVQQAGYVMEDAFRRDRAAWELAESGRPLWIAFRETSFGNFRNVDQYGGLLALSAAVYRYSGTPEHSPLLMVLVSAGFSSLVVPLGWAFSGRLFDKRLAAWSAWAMALYPEAVLLGSSQMREAIMMPLAAAACFGLVRLRQERSWQGAAWLGVALLLSLPLSPPLAAILFGLLVVLGLALFDWALLRSWRLWAIAGGASVLILAGLWLGWDQVAPRWSAEQFSNPLAMVAHWVELSARWQARLTQQSSGWVQSIFESTPEWFNLPFLLAYGAVRPFLPAQLTAWSIPIWWIIGLWRAIGWTVLLPLLAYAPVRAFRMPQKRNIVTGLVIAVWLTILIASFWGGGDQWDNPRYRVAFIALQIPLAAWTIAEQLRSPDAWMRRMLIAAGILALWFMPWYLRRYTAFDQIFGWQVIDLFKLLGLGAATAILYLVWDLAGREPS